MWRNHTIRLFSATRLRNIGIVAHIDSGKTTTTERMLYYSGIRDKIANVDEGNTMTDFLEEERERGITIQSACVTIPWNGHKINIVDTPGHIDFSFEVERCLRVLDGVITIVDGVSGVQAQTETVWRQTRKYEIPRIVFVNKMDRDGASVERVVDGMKRKFPEIDFVIVQIAAIEQQGQKNVIREIVDLVRLKRIKWEGKNGQDLVVEQVVEDDRDYKSILQFREKLIEQVANLDDQIMEKFIEGEEIDVELLQSKIRELAIQCKVVPVLCGSSLKFIGVQPLMDAIVDYLPSPVERPPLHAEHLSASAEMKTEMLKCDENAKFCALAFKVIYDLHKGPVVFIRVFSGKLTTRDQLKVSRLKTNASGKQEPITERISKLFQIQGASWNEIDSVKAGDICAITGLRFTKTGDTLSVSKSATALKQSGISVPKPVFFASIEPENAMHEKNLEKALENIQLEDPSIISGKDESSGLQLLKGMGELHLQVVHRRLLKHYGVRCALGQMQVAYRETLEIPVHHRSVYQLSSLNPNVIPPKVLFEFKLHPQPDNDEVQIVYSENVLKSCSENIRQIVQESLLNGMYSSGTFGYPVSQIKIEVVSVEPGDSSVVLEKIEEGPLSMLTLRAFRDTFSRGVVTVLEPIMGLEIQAPSEFIGAVSSDISRRRGNILNLEELPGQPSSILIAQAPLSELLNYSTVLRSLTQGSAQFSIQLKCFNPTRTHPRA
jgi:elongation factor G